MGEAGESKRIDQPESRILNALDAAVNWSRKNSLWPFFFGLSCCFIEEAITFTSRYDIARFGSEVFRGSPRQGDLLIVSGTVFKKMAPALLRLYEQMSEPKWVISMGSCSNSGGMFDVYSVVQGVDQILPVDVYVPGCPPRPEALLQGLVLLQQKIAAKERPSRSVFHLGDGIEGTTKPVLIDGKTKSRDTRGPGYQGVPIRGTSVVAPKFWGTRSDNMWAPPAHRIELNAQDKSLSAALRARFKNVIRQEPHSSDMPTFYVRESHIKEVLRFLKDEAAPKYQRLDDLTAIDETARRDCIWNKGYAQAVQDVAMFEERPMHGVCHNYTLVYHLLSFEGAARLRLKVGFIGESPTAKTVSDIWPSANWYEREVYDMFGIRFEGHPDLRRILLPHDWDGHPLRKSYPARGTLFPPFTRADAEKHQPLDASRFVKVEDEEREFILNYGPHHFGTHGVIRFILALRGEMVTDVGIDIGYHHRAKEKTGEVKSWHQFIPYTDRVDYLAGVANNLSYLQSVETLAGIKVPDRAKFIRVMLSELFRVSNHLLWIGTFTHDLGGMGPTFYTTREREMLMDIIELITGARLHPSWFRIGGVAQDLPEGWKEKIDELLKIMPSRLKEYEALLTRNPIFKARTQGIGRLPLRDAMEWGVTGPNLRASGLEWDLRKKMPYSSYEAFDFDVPTQTEGDCYARYLIRIEELRQSLRIVRQAADGMPPGRYITDEYRYTVPKKDDALQDIDSLIHHFVNVSRGPKMPWGEAYTATEAPRGEQGYYIVSDGLNMAYRMRIRGPDFANIQTIPLMSIGRLLPDFASIIGSLDYIAPDTDR